MRGRPRKGDRVSGPHWDKARRRWYFRVRYGDGAVDRRRLPRGTSEADAFAAVSIIRAEVEHGERVESVSDAIGAYLDHLRRIGDRPETIDWTRRALARLSPDTMITALGPAHLDRYLRAVEGLAMSTRRSYWLALTRWSAWIAAERWTVHDVAAAFVARRRDPLPWATRAGAREIGRGKPQLRGEAEAIAYVAAAGALPTAEERVAAQLPIRCGLSSGEVLHLTDRSIDLAGDQIWIGDAEDGSWSVKTASRRRNVPIPAALRADLIALASRPGWIFRGRMRGTVEIERPRCASWLRGLVRRVCTSAGVLVVSPHGLRDTYASLLRARQRRSIADIGDALGHGDRGRTAARHYIGAPEHKPELTLLAGGISGPISGPKPKK